MYYLFTTPSCPNCPRAKQLVQENNLEVELVDASTTEGLDMAKKYSIAQVPTLLELDDKEELVNKHSGIGEISTALE